MATVTKPRRKSRKAPQSRLFVAHDPDLGKRISALDPNASGRGKTFWCAGCLRHGKQLEMEYVAGKPVPYFRKKTRKDHHPSCPYKNLQAFVSQTAEEVGVSSPASADETSGSRNSNRDGHHEWMKFIQRVLSEVELNTCKERASSRQANVPDRFGKRLLLTGYVSDADRLLQGSSGESRNVLLLGRAEKIAFSGDRFLIHLADGGSREHGISCHLSVSRFLYGERTVIRLQGHWVAARGLLVKKSPRQYRMEIRSFPEQLVILDPALPELPPPVPQIRHIRHAFSRLSERAGFPGVPEAFFRSWYGPLAEESAERFRSLARNLEKELRLAENQITILKQQWKKCQEKLKGIRQRQAALERRLPRFLANFLVRIPLIRRLRYRSWTGWNALQSEAEPLSERIRNMHEKWLALEWSREKIRDRLRVERQTTEELVRLKEQEEALKKADSDLLFHVAFTEENHIGAARIRVDVRERTVLLEARVHRFLLEEGFFIPVNDPSVQVTGTAELSSFEEDVRAWWDQVLKKARSFPET